MKRLRALAGHQFTRFALTGGVAALVNLGSRVVLSRFFSFEVAVVLAYLVGMLTAYTLARLFVFNASGRGIRSELIRFTLVNLVALVQVWVISVGLARLIFPALGFTWYPEPVAHFVGVLFPVITSYLGHRHYSFRPH
ncbi:MAG: GtrA family protein [Gammaproteobacteria bacterium]|nr:GtrA family protein [Gammaproteobacteria bacterium]